MVFVDTDVLIDVQRGFEPAVQWIGGLAELPAVTGFTVLELLQDARDSTEVRRSIGLTRAMAVHWPNSLDCELAKDCFARLHLSRGVGLLDVLIAFTVIGVGGELFTGNVKHFKVIPGLRVQQPYKKT